MHTTADPLIDALDEALDDGPGAEAVQSALRRVLDRLASTDRDMEWEVVPLDVFGGVIPDSIRSCWVFGVRAGAETGAERHPNSHQRSLSLAGSGTFDVREAEWVAHPLVSDRGSPTERRWVTIPPSTWHRLSVGRDAWGMVSFHTVPASELMEEKPVDPADLDGPTRGSAYYGRQ